MARLVCEQCLRPLPPGESCPRHPFSEPLDVTIPADREQLSMMRRMRWERRIRVFVLTAFVLLTAGLSFGSDVWFVAGPLGVIQVGMAVAVGFTLLYAPIYVFQLLTESIRPAHQPAVAQLLSAAPDSEDATCARLNRQAHSARRTRITT